MTQTLSTGNIGAPGSSQFATPTTQAGSTTVSDADMECQSPAKGYQTSAIPYNADSKIINNNVIYTAESPQGDSSFGIIGSTGSHITCDEKGTIQVKASSPVAEDLTCGRIEIESQSNTRLTVGTSFVINVNQGGKHDENAPVSNSSTQSVSEKRYPAFSIHVANGGLDIECADGDINLTGRNIVLNAGENITFNATRSISLLAGFDAIGSLVGGALKALFGFELPISGGGEVIVKAGKFINDSTTSTTTSSKVETKAGGYQSFETGSSMGTTTIKQSGDLNLSTSGNVLLAAGQKMRIEAQGTVVNPTGPATLPIWGFTQLEALVITANKNSIPLPTAMRIEVDNGNLIQSVTKVGGIGIITQTGAIALAAGVPFGSTITALPGDIDIRSVKGNIKGVAALEAAFLGKTIAGFGLGIPGATPDVVAVYAPGFGFDSATGGVVAKTTKGAAAMLGQIQVGMGIGPTPAASVNSLAFNTTGMIQTVTGPTLINKTGAVTKTITGAVTETITGAVTKTITGAVTTTRTGAYTETITGTVAKTITGAVTDTTIGAVARTIAGASVDTVAGLATTISPTGIVLNSAVGVDIKGPKINIDSAGPVIIKGSTITVDGGTAVVITAGTIKLN